MRRLRRELDATGNEAEAQRLAGKDEKAPLGCASGLGKPRAQIGTADGASVDSSPALGADGALYVGDDSGRLHALHPNGTERWQISLGSDPAMADAAGNTALHYAAYMRHDSVIESLVQRGAPLNGTNKYGETPLWASQLVVQFSGGGTYQLIPSAASAELRKLGAESIAPTYTRARPTEWPDVPRGANDQVAKPVEPSKAGAPQK